MEVIVSLMRWLLYPGRKKPNTNLKEMDYLQIHSESHGKETTLYLSGFKPLSSSLKTVILL
jgi:hypothetical protein